MEIRTACRAALSFDCISQESNSVKFGSRHLYPLTNLTSPSLHVSNHGAPAGKHLKDDCDSGAYLSTLAHFHVGRKHVTDSSSGPKTAGQVLSVSASSKMCCRYRMVWAENTSHSCRRSVVTGQAVRQDALEELIIVRYLCLSSAAPSVCRDPASLAAGHTPHHALHRGREPEGQTHSGL